MIPSETSNLFFNHHNDPWRSIRPLLRVLPPDPPVIVRNAEARGNRVDQWFKWSAGERHQLSIIG